MIIKMPKLRNESNSLQKYGEGDKHLESKEINSFRSWMENHAQPKAERDQDWRLKIDLFDVTLLRIFHEVTQVRNVNVHY